MQGTLSYPCMVCKSFFAFLAKIFETPEKQVIIWVKGGGVMIWNERIKQLRKEFRLTLKEVAARLGVTEGTAQRYENNIKSIPYEIIVAYSKIFRCSPAYIMGWVNPSSDFTPEEIEIIHAFRKADEIDRESVRRTLGVSGKNNEYSEVSA